MDAQTWICFEHAFAQRNFPAACTKSAQEPVLRAISQTGGHVADCRAAELLLGRVPQGIRLLADLGDDTDAVRAAVSDGGSAPNIPPKRNRRFKPPFSPVLYRARSAIERIFGRLKDFHRIATPYDKLAANFLAAVHLTAAISYWL